VFSNFSITRLKIAQWEF